MLSHVPAGGFKVGKLSQVAQFQPSFHFICSGSNSKEILSAMSSEHGAVKEGEPTPSMARQGHTKAKPTQASLLDPAWRGEQGITLG